MAVNKSVNLAAKVLGSILNLRAMGVFEGAQRASANTPIARGAGDLGVQRAARFFYLQKLGFGGKVDGQTFGVATTSKARLNLLRLEEDLSQVHLRLHQVTIEHMDWAACVERYDRPHTLFYLDTPYYGTEGYGVDFGLDQYGRMAELLHTMQGKAPVSVNDMFPV